MTPSHHLPPSHPARHTPFCLHALLTAMLALGLSASPGEALAKRSKNDPAMAGESAKKKGVSKITYQRSTSEESTAERDRRLYRECKGMHNAGACRGYTRK